MNKPFNKEHWYISLNEHIKVVSDATRQRKTILINRDKPYLYTVVTRVNYLTNLLWIDFVNEKIKQINSDKFDKQRWGWLSEQKHYRIDFLNKLKHECKRKS